MRIRVQVLIESDQEATPPHVEEVACFERDQLSLFPRVAQRDGLSCELALSLTLTCGHLIGLQPRESRCKQPDEA